LLLLVVVFLFEGGGEAVIVCVGLLGACVVPVPAHNLKIQQRLIPHHNTPTHTRLPTTTHTDVNDTMYIFCFFPLSLVLPFRSFVRFLFLHPLTKTKNIVKHSASSRPSVESSTTLAATYLRVIFLFFVISNYPRASKDPSHHRSCVVCFLFREKFPFF
jgi:hypothetical protein